ncbi:MAG TPA: hypothetical protein VGM13_04835 [Thermoanaerobaculia bacterium]|jgi:hypothetical protein
MAEVTLKTQDLKDALENLSKKVKSAAAWLPNQPEIKIEIPDPFPYPGPDATRPCFGPPPQGEFGEIGLLMGILKAMNRKGGMGAGKPGLKG